MKKFALLICDVKVMNYIILFNNFLNLSGEEFEMKGFEVCNGNFPESVDLFDIAIITGSPHSVYEELDWFDEKMLIPLLNKMLLG